MLDLVLCGVVFLPVLIIALHWIYTVTSGSKTVSTIPGLDPSSKEAGNLGDMSRAGSLHQFLMELHSRFGPITAFWWGKTHVVSIASPELMKEHHHVFDRPQMLFKSFEIMMGARNLQWTNGPTGRDRRKAYDPVFAHDKMARYLFYFDELAKKVESKWSEKGADDHIPLSEEVFLYAIQAALVSILGDNYKDEKKFLRFKNCYDLVWNEMENAIMNSTQRDEERQDKFEKSIAYLQESIKETVSHRKDDKLHFEENLLIDVLIEKYPDDEDIIISDALGYLVGGFHTTGNVLTWGLYYLATHKDVQDKVYEEIKRVLGVEETVDENNYPDFVYLNQVIDETLRCAVIGPWAARYQDVDSELGGHKIPKNTPVIHALGVMSQNEKLWPMPNKFDPDRFSPENRKKMSSYTFVPFGFAGKRKCPGYRFAYWDSVVYIVAVLRRFEISLWPNQNVTSVYGLVTHPKDEIWVKVTKRN